MKIRFLHSLYLAPAVFLLLMWFVVAQAVMMQLGTLGTLAAAIVSAMVSAWCITLFSHALRRDLK